MVKLNVRRVSTYIFVRQTAQSFAERALRYKHVTNLTLKKWVKMSWTVSTSRFQNSQTCQSSDWHSYTSTARVIKVIFERNLMAEVKAHRDESLIGSQSLNLKSNLDEILQECFWYHEVSFLKIWNKHMTYTFLLKPPSISTWCGHWVSNGNVLDYKMWFAPPDLKCGE